MNTRILKIRDMGRGCKRYMFVAAVVLAAITFSSCATIITSRYENILVVAPEGTSIARDGELIGAVPDGETHTTITIRRGLRKFTMTASKPGYQTVDFVMNSRMNIPVLFNILILPAVAVDLINGAAGEYPNYVEMELDPEE